MIMAVIKNVFGSGRDAAALVEQPTVAERPRFDRLILECLRKNNSKLRIVIHEIRRFGEEPNYYAIAVRLTLLRDLITWNLDTEVNGLVVYVEAWMKHTPSGTALLEDIRRENEHFRKDAARFFSGYVGKVWDADLKSKFWNDYAEFVSGLETRIHRVERELYQMYLPSNILKNSTIGYR